MIAVPVRFRIPGLGAASRLTLFAVSAAGGALLQAFVPGAFLWGTLLMVLPLAVLAARPWTNKPADLGEEEWQPAGDAELDRIADAFRTARKLRLPFWYRRGSGIPATLFLGAGALLFGIRSPLGLACFDGLLLLWPALHFLRIRIWIPRTFELVMGALQAARSVPVPEGMTLTPYLRLDRDAEGLRIPEDARLMAERRRMSDDLVGFQVQAAVNNGPNGAVPYLYAVAITRGQGPSWRSLAEVRIRGYEVEASADGDYGTVVIRQATGGGGYHTDAEDCRRLMGHVYELLRSL